MFPGGRNAFLSLRGITTAVGRPYIWYLSLFIFFLFPHNYSG